MPGSKAPTPHQRPAQRAANWLVRYGAPGAFLAFLLLRVEATPLALLHLKSAKLLPVALLCCAQMGWLFGGAVGVLLAIQWLVHELAHMHAAQKIGLRPGWRSFVPFVGVYAGTTPQDYRTREDEALVALSGVTAGLVLATALFGYGQMIQSPAMVLAAKLGYGLNLINLLPFRPFDGGRIFPGYLWRYASDAQDDAAGDIASRRFIAVCRSISEWCYATPAGRPKDNGSVLADATVALMLGAVGAVAVIGLLLPPLAFSLALLAVFAGLWSFIAALIALDPRAVLAPAAGALHPRRGGGLRLAGPVDLPWQDRRSATAALAIFVMAMVACMVGLWVA